VEKGEEEEKEEERFGESLNEEFNNDEALEDDNIIKKLTNESIATEEGEDVDDPESL
jgi:hypothetical protein